MPFKEWAIELGEFRILLWRQTTEGVLVDFLVALLAWNGEQWACITRYDCAHGFPHRDLLGRRSGLLYKEEFPGLTLNEVFNHAVNDFKTSYEAHASFFNGH